MSRAIVNQCLQFAGRNPLWLCAREGGERGRRRGRTNKHPSPKGGSGRNPKVAGVLDVRLIGIEDDDAAITAHGVYVAHRHVDGNPILC